MKNQQEKNHINIFVGINISRKNKPKINIIENHKKHPDVIYDIYHFRS